MERFIYRAGEKDQGAVALGMDLAKAFERVRLPVVWAWATHFSFPKEDTACCAGTLNTRGESITAILPGSTWSCLLLRIVLQGALSEVIHI